MCLRPPHVTADCCLHSRFYLDRHQFIVAGCSIAKVKSLLDEGNNRLRSALPGQPVTIAGWKSLPSAGEVFLQVESEVSWFAKSSFIG